jgi:sugar transferase (PEP-CTERM/EpsH1 system associated)
MRDLLFLTQRIPYPPTKGDKIRSWNFLRHLAAHYRVHLGCFIDDPADQEHVPVLEELCASVKAIRLDPRTGKLLSLVGLLSGKPLTLPYFYAAELDRFVGEVLARHAPDSVFVFSSAVAQYVPRARLGAARLVVDMVDVDSQKWQQYAPSKPWPLSAIYAREARRLLAFERQVAAEADATLFVSSAEAALFRRLAPETAERVAHVDNGVDCAFFDPENGGASPFAADEEAIVFTGAMDYWPNIDAVAWFAEEVWPNLRAARPAASFVIVGTNPAPAVRRLAALPGIRVTGRVEDVRPYLAHARLVVAPLRIAQGVQNKVLEAMSMARPVVASPQALDGIAAEPGRHLVVAAEAEEFAAACAQLLSSGSSPLGDAARAHVLRYYTWERNLARLTAILDAAQPQGLVNEWRSKSSERIHAAG